MKKRNILRFVSLLVAIALIIAFAPTGIVETAEASVYYHFKAPENNITVKTGTRIPVKMYCAPQITTTYTDGRVVYEEMPVTLKVFKGSEEIYSEDFTYMYEGTIIETNYTPQTSGTLKLCLYGQPLGLDNTELTLQDTITIKVKKQKASAVKKIKPSITVERTAKKTAVITCTNSSGFGMKIYRATKKNGKYKLIKTTKKATFTDKSLSAKKVYYYKVKLFSKTGTKKYYSKWSKVKKAAKYKKPTAPVENPVITSVRKVGDGVGNTSLVRISWKKLNSYSKSKVDFFVCRKEPGDELYMKLEGKVIWGDGVIYLTDDTAVPGKTYLYNVYASSLVQDYTCDTLEPARFTVP